MDRYLRRGRIGNVLDELGLRGAITLAAVGWFVFLWGVSGPALTAGLALSVLGQMAVTQYRRCSVGRREQALRARLGGEMLLDELLLKPRRQAHVQAAMLLAGAYRLKLERVEDEGVLCRCGDEPVLVSCLAKAPDSEAAAEDALVLQRACRRHLAQRGILCLTCRAGKGLADYAEGGAVPIRVISRDTLLALAGRVNPATDEQLVALGKRKKRPGASGSLRATIINRNRAGRYMFYGTAMLLAYILTGAGWYPLPGLVLLCLGAACRGDAGRKETL